LSSLIEPELHAEPPRQAELTPEGRRKLLLWTIPIASAIALCSLLFFSRPQPRWVAYLFAVFALAGAAVLFRLVSLWLARLQLVEEGVAIAAMVVVKEEAARGAARYYAWYEIDGRQCGIGWTSDGQDAQVGDSVTVLYLPSKPSQAVAYRWSGCVVSPKRGDQQTTADAAHSSLNPRI
jgi:hypothetical protein